MLSHRTSEQVFRSPVTCWQTPGWLLPSCQGLHRRCEPRCARLHLGSCFHSVGVREGESQRRVGRRRETLGDGKACFHGGCPVLHPCEHRGAVPISPHPQRHLFSVCRFVGSNYHLPCRREQRSVLTESHGWVRTAESRGAGRAEASGILQEVSLQRKTEGGQGRICKLGYGLESPTQVAHHGSQACRKETPRRAQVAGTLHLAFTPSPSSAFRARV